MNNIQTTLVILLAVGYLILILTTIIAAVIVVKILQNIRHITQKAATTSDNMADLVKSLGKKVAPVALSTVMGAVMKRFNDKRKAKNNQDDE